MTSVTDDEAREQGIRDEAFVRGVSESLVRGERDRNLAWATAVGFPPAPEMSPELLAMMRRHLEPAPTRDFPPPRVSDPYQGEAYQEPRKVLLELWMLVGLMSVGGLWLAAVEAFDLGYYTSFFGALASIPVGMFGGFCLATKRKYGTWWV